MQVNPPPGGPIQRLGRRARLVLVVVTLSAAVAIAANAGGLVGTGRTDTPATGPALTRAGLGALIGLMLGIIVVILLQRIAPSRPAVQRLLYGVRDPCANVAFRRSLPLVLLLAGVGALVGASTAPSKSQSESPPPAQTSRSSASLQAVTPPHAGDARYVDRNGRRELQVDRDGDGRFESVYVLCPGGELPTTNPTSSTGTDAAPGTSRVPNGMVRIPIDHGCDGTIDEYVDVRLQDVPTDASPSDPNAPPKRSTTTTAPLSGPTLGSSLSTVILILLAAAVIAAIVIGIARRKPKPPAPTATSDAADPALVAVATSVARSSDALTMDGDPRRAILAAYGQLLDGLTAAGMPRRPEEAPEEYLRRCLADVSADRAPFEELTSLFTLARFSRHDITEAHRRAAAAALQRAGQSLPNACAEVST